jgi:hypothetical protein
MPYRAVALVVDPGRLDDPDRPALHDIQDLQATLYAMGHL